MAVDHPGKDSTHIRVLAVLLIPIAFAAIGMLRQWRARERAVQVALARRERPSSAALLAQIDVAIARLVDEYGLDTMTQPQLLEAPRFSGEGASYFRGILALAAERWQVRLPSIELALVPTERRGANAAEFIPNAPGGYDFSTPESPVQGTSWRVSVSPHHLQDPLALTTLGAHEFAHGVLGRDGVSCGAAADDEVLTEVAAALVGFGVLMLQLQRRVERSFRRKDLLYSFGGPGYLWPHALEHVLARQVALRSAVDAT